VLRVAIIFAIVVALFALFNFVAFRATHGGAFRGIPPTGSPVSFEVVDILTIHDAKIHEHRVALDKLGLLQQLGAMPA
jgi:predicted ester cyclase